MGKEMTRKAHEPARQPSRKGRRADVFCSRISLVGDVLLVVAVGAPAAQKPSGTDLRHAGPT
jgi:hypothetical protein